MIKTPKQAVEINERNSKPQQRNRRYKEESKRSFRTEIKV